MSMMQLIFLGLFVLTVLQTLVDAKKKKKHKKKKGKKEKDETKPEDFVKPIKNEACGVHVKMWDSEEQDIQVRIMAPETWGTGKDRIDNHTYDTLFPLFLKPASIPLVIGPPNLIIEPFATKEPSASLKFTYGDDVWYSWHSRCCITDDDNVDQYPGTKIEIDAGCVWHREMDCSFACRMPENVTIVRYVNGVP